MFTGYAAANPDAKFEKLEFDPGELRPEQVEIEVEYCGICHSDLSMKKNEWGLTEYPFVGGHEIVGKVVATGERASSIQAGQRVGLGWTAGSCMSCDQCVGGHQNRCPDGEPTIVGRHGGFADRVRGQANWTVPIPDGIEAAACGPLFCGGLTVFAPFVENAILPTSHVAIVGIGGLGHMALQFARAWGCHVTAFSTSPDKEGEAKKLGAHDFLNSRDDAALEAARNRFDLVLVTVNAPLDWDAYVAALKPGGRLHLVGAAESVKATLFPLLAGEKQIGASPTGSIIRMREMIRFAARHDIEPMIERYPMAEINDAMERLESGKARYRIVLEA